MTARRFALTTRRRRSRTVGQVLISSLESAAEGVLSSLPGSAVAVYDQELRLMSVAGTGLSALGLSESDVGRTFSEVFEPAAAARLEAQCRLALGGHQLITDVHFADRIAEYRLGPLRNSTGGIIGGIALAQDVTLVRRSESILRESTSRYQLAFERAPIGKALIGLNFRFQVVNHALCDISGYGPSQLQQFTLADVVHPDDGPADLAGMQRLLNDEVRIFRSELRWQLSSGTSVWVTKSVSLLRAEDGRPLQFVAQIQDISERRIVEQELALERRRLLDAQTIGRMGSWEMDIREGGKVTWSDALLALRGITRAQFEGDLAGALRMVHPDDSAAVGAALQNCAKTGEPILVRYRATRVDDGSPRWFDARGTATYAAGERVSIVGTVIDVTEDVLAEAKAVASAAFQHAVIDASPDIIFVYDLVAESTTWSNRSLVEMLGYEADDPGLVGGVDALVLAADQMEFGTALAAARHAPTDKVIECHYRMLAANGSYRWFTRRTVPLRRGDDGSVLDVVGVLSDNTDALEAKRGLEHAALHDGLTGLPNRTLLRDRLEGALVRSERDQREVSVLYCDLDGFKRVNDTEGHAAGDAVLREVAGRLQGVLRTGDTVARVGGDEFVIIVEPWNRMDTPGLVERGWAADRAMASNIADRIAASLRPPITVDGVDHLVSASIGIAYGLLSSADHTVAITAEQVLRDADTAMYLAKSLGKACFAVFEPSPAALH